MSAGVGLGSEEARRRLIAVGPNEIAGLPRTAGVRQIVALFASPLVLVLLAASAVSAALGETANASIIVVMVGLSVTLEHVQTSRSQRAAARLRETVVPTATVVRDGAAVEVRRRELVPGDVILLAAGDRVPADARLVEARDLHVHEAALTGESMPVEKRPGDDGHHGVVFLGTSVVSGTATALVTATGPRTAFGDVAARLAGRPPETEFERGLRSFAVLILRVVLLLVLFVLLASAALGRPFLDSLVFAVALAVGLTPEFLPMITAVTLAHGAVQMARRRVIVKHLAAIEDFGSLDILCSDKTGTLTSGAMALDRALDAAGRPADRPFFLAYLNSVHESGVASPLDAAIRAYAHPAVDGYRKLDEVPFDFERRRISVVVETPDGRRLLIV
jgi:Mg2+-importing ATPase